MAKRWYSPLFDNLSLKASALVISLGIWFYANSRLTDEFTCWAVLTISPPQGYAIVYQSDAKTRITVSGPRSLVSRLRGEFMQVPLRLTHSLDENELRDGQATLQVAQLWRGADIEERDRILLKLHDPSPEQVQVIASPRVERKLPVNVRVSVQPAPGFEKAASPTATPAEVHVSGPALALEAMTSVDTVDLTLYDVRSDTQRPIELRPEFKVTLPTGKEATVPLDVEPSTVTVNVSVAGEEQKEQRYPNIPLLRMDPPGFPYQAEFGKGDGDVTVVVLAPPSLRKLDPAQIRAYVDLSPLASEKIDPGASAPYRERVQVQLPPGTAYGEAWAEPDHVTVVLKNVPR